MRPVVQSQCRPGRCRAAGAAAFSSSPVCSEEAPTWAGDLPACEEALASPGPLAAQSLCPTAQQWVLAKGWGRWGGQGHACSRNPLQRRWLLGAVAASLGGSGRACVSQATNPTSAVCVSLACRERPSRLSWLSAERGPSRPQALFRPLSLLRLALTRDLRTFEFALTFRHGKST